MGNPFDGGGVKNLLINMTEEDAPTTEAYAAAQTAEELKRQNDLYEKEIRGTKWRGWVTLAISFLSLLVSSGTLFFTVWTWFQTH